MTTQTGYVHISVRNAQRRREALASAGYPNYYRAPSSSQVSLRPAASRHQVFSAGDQLIGRSAQLPPVAEAEAEDLVDTLGGEVAPGTAVDTEARGFVIYVGLDEDAAAQAGTSLAKLSAQLQAHLQELVPGAPTHAAVAIAPANISGSDLAVTRKVLGDPTAQGGTSSRTSSSVPSGGGTGILLDLGRREVFLDGEPLSLTYKEFELLSFLVANPDRTISRDDLLDTLWASSNEIPNERTIDVHVRRLRAKLGRLSNTVRTVRGQGYRFYEHPEVSIWSAPEYSI